VAVAELARDEHLAARHDARRAHPDGDGELAAELRHRLAPRALEPAAAVERERAAEDARGPRLRATGGRRWQSLPLPERSRTVFPPPSSKRQ
jgi:hypothetical protein